MIAHDTRSKAAIERAGSNTGRSRNIVLGLVLYLMAMTILMVVGCTATPPSPPGVVEIVEPNEFETDDAEKTLTWAVTRLHTNVPLSYPTVIRVLDLTQYGAWGLIRWVEETGHYEIWLHKGTPWPVLVNTMVHEWAHALAWEDPSFLGSTPPLRKHDICRAIMNTADCSREPSIFAPAPSSLRR